MDRRYFARMMAALGAAKVLAVNANTSSQVPKPAPTLETAEAQHEAAMQSYASFVAGDKVTIGMLVYPGMFLQDLVGPLAVFEALMNRDIHLLWKDLEPVGNEAGQPTALIPVRPTTSFANCPAQLDVLFVPGGGPGTIALMEDKEVIAFLQDKGKTARFVTSVCTGSLILGAAGLLNGYKATSYWAAKDVLAELGAFPTQGRVVVDRNRITGGGVTAGIDFGLTLAAKLRSDDYAKAIQLYLEYDPQPPFNAGSPSQAPKIARQFIEDMFVGLRETAIAASRRARKLMPAAG